MNSDLQPPMDEMINQELLALRKPVESKSGLGDAILAMQSRPKIKGWRTLRWPIGIGSAAAGALVIIMVGSLITTNAYAGELRAIGAAQAKQLTKHQRSILYLDGKKPIMIMEFWSDRNKEAFRQFTPEGHLEIARVFDGKRKYHYAPSGGATGKPWATVEDAQSPDFGIESLDSVLSGRLARENRITKQAGVRLNGRDCDYYSIGNGHYRLWIDPATRLPLKREIYDKGVTLWKRDIYDYPKSFAESTFKPVQPGGLVYIEVNRGLVPREAPQKANRGGD